MNVYGNLDLLPIEMLKTVVRGKTVSAPHLIAQLFFITAQLIQIHIVGNFKNNIQYFSRKIPIKKQNKTIRQKISPFTPP